MKQTGKVYLVGAGPGDDRLITVRALECIQHADLIVYDNLVNPALLRHAQEEADLVYVGKTPRKHTLTQDEINELLVTHAKAGRIVARLKGGDPFVFGRGGEEAEQLRKAGIKFEIIPGISSAIAAPAYAGIPVTHRDFASGMMVVTGHEDPTKENSSVDWKQVAQFTGTRVILMGVERIGKIADHLITLGASPDTPVAMIRQGTTSQQKTIHGTLRTIEKLAMEHEICPPAVIVIGEVARLTDQLNWFEQLPLFGKRIAVTRSRHQASELVRRLADLGADVLEIPTIRIRPPKKIGPLREAIKHIGIYDWVVFTSPNGVDAFFREFFHFHDDIRELGVLKIAAIGEVTAKKIEALHFAVDLQPAEFTSDALLREFKKTVSCENLKFLLPRANLADTRLSEGLENLGGIVDALDAYETILETEDYTGHRARLLKEGADLITFTSSSTVANFCKLINVGELVKKFPQLAFVSIGPQTTKAAIDNGLTIASEAAVYTIVGLVDSILQMNQRDEAAILK